MRKKTHEEFVAEVKELVGDEYAVLGTYVGANNKILIRHDVCGYEYNVKPSAFIRGNRCKKCYYSNKTKSHNQFVNEVFNLVGDEYEILGEYTNSQSKITIKHVKCNYNYRVKPNDFLQGSRCPKCAGRIKNKDTSYFKQEIFELVNNEYSLLGEYVNSKTKILMKHNKCSYEWKIRPSDFIQGKRCPKCAGRTRDTNQFKQEVFDIVGDEYLVLGEYINSKTNIKMKHNISECNYEYEVRASKFIEGCRCPKCAGVAKKNTDIFKKEVYDLVGDEYEILGEYKGANIKLLIKHQSCGRTYEVTPSNFLYGCRCSKCSGKMKKTTGQFKEEVFDLVKNEFTVIGEYINAHTKIEMKHNKCGNYVKIAPSQFLHGNRCVYCKNDIISEKKSKTNTEFLKEVHELVGKEYQVLDKYIRSQVKIKMLHNRCGNVIEIAPNNFLQGKRCPICAESKGEQVIRHWLESKNIDFVSQKEFVELIGLGGGHLSYDFYLPKHNLLIEYQGEFHDGNGNYYMKKNLKKQHEHDRRKREYAKQHSIGLLEIWYWDFDNIEATLEKELSNLIPQPM